jgi:thiamine pyrophosphate-dependent acetolactate synthase large subunit-like protein
LTELTRLEATHRVAASLAEDDAVVASLGHPAYDLFAAGDRPLNFYTWGSMGLASSIGLGLAMAQPDRRVFVLDGDGSLLMNLGALATIAVRRPPNLVVVIWDNEEYGTTGGQPTATASGADLAAAARAVGVERTCVARSGPDLDAVLTQCRRTRGPWVIVVKVRESHPVVKPPLDCQFLTRRFMSAMGVSPDGAAGS